MGVRIVAKYDNPTLIEEFSAASLLRGNNRITNDDIDYQCDCTVTPCSPETVWSCSEFDAYKADVWCNPRLGFPSGGGCALTAFYRLPTLLKTGVWHIDIELSVESTGSPPDPFDPDLMCYYNACWGCNGTGFAYTTGGDTFGTWPDGEILFIDGKTGSCPEALSTDTSLSASIDVGLYGWDLEAACNCGGLGLPEISFGRYGDSIQSHYVSIHGVWVSDFIP